MNTLRTALSLILVATLALPGCIEKSPYDSSYEMDEPTSAEPAITEASVRLEQAERSLDTGRDIDKATLTLVELVRQTSVSSEIRDRASLSLSRAYELQNDKEHAIAAVEALLVSHVDDHAWPGSDAANKRLRKLLTGKDEYQDSLRGGAETVSRFARTLAHFFPAKKDSAVEIPILAFGGESEVSEKQGTFQIGAALRQKAEEACPLCDAKVRVRTSFSRSDSWTSIPASKEKMAHSLVVFYTHLDDPIPSRYNALLPIKMEEVIAHLEKGEAIVSALQRKDAPPVILLATPRKAQLAELEALLADRTELPATKEVVKVAPNLMPHEIQSQVRTKMPAFRACYESLLGRAPGASGKVTLAFTIAADGGVTDLHVATEGPQFDSGMGACVTDAANTLRFAKTGVTTTVKYPVSFTP